MSRGVGQRQPDERPARLRVPQRCPLAHEVGKRDQPLAPRRYVHRRPIEIAERIRPPAHGVPEPTGERSGGRRSPPGVGAVRGVDHVRHGDQLLGEVLPGVDDPPTRGRPHHGDVVPAVERPSGEGRHRGVHPTAEDRGPGGQPGEARSLRGHLADNRFGGDDAFRHQLERDPERPGHLLRPGVCPDVVQPAEVAGRGMIDRDLAGQAVVDVRVRGEEQGDPLPVVRLVVLDPQDLGVAEVAVDPVSGHGEQLLQIDVTCDPLHFGRRPPVHPDEARSHRPHLLIERNPASSVQPTDADPGYLLRGDPGVLQELSDDRARRVEPHVRPLLGPYRLGVKEPVLRARRLNEAPVPPDEHPFGPLRAHVHSEKISCHTECRLLHVTACNYTKIARLTGPRWRAKMKGDLAMLREDRVFQPLLIYIIVPR